MAVSKQVICISWNENLGRTREWLLRDAGFNVRSATGQQGMTLCGEDADLMVLGHSVPPNEKRQLIDCFRQHSNAPVLSLLRTGQEKLPEATHAIDASDPAEFVATVRRILYS